MPHWVGENIFIQGYKTPSLKAKDVYRKTVIVLIMISLADVVSLGHGACQACELISTQPPERTPLPRSDLLSSPPPEKLPRMTFSS